MNRLAAPKTKPSAARESVLLPSYDLDEIENGAASFIAQVKSSLINLGAIVIRSNNYRLVDELGSFEARRFFNAPESKKRVVEGKKHFTKIHGDVDVTFTHAGSAYCRRLGDLLGGERGWIRRGSSPSGADKEYFQFGSFGQYRPVGLQALKHNLWPIIEGGANYQKAKEGQLEWNERVHKAMLALLKGELIRGAYHGKAWTLPYEIICRDTLYHPTSKSKRVHDISLSRVRNPPHVDLSNGTLISHADGLQLYLGNKHRVDAISVDEIGWKNIDTDNLGPDSQIYLLGLATEITTRGRYAAVWHRVISGSINHMGRHRLSSVSFCNAGIDDMLKGGKDHRGIFERYPDISRNVLPVVGNQMYVRSMRLKPPFNTTGLAAHALSRSNCNSSAAGY